MEEDERAVEFKGLFEDPVFICEDSLFSDYSTPIARFQDDITWLRPQEICPSPTLFPDNTNDGHAKQGLLGDCWFLCACTILLKYQHLMNKVVPPAQPQWGERGYRGSFLFRLWQHGCWTEVTVDDRLPCLSGKLCFSRCQSPTAFWVALLEKAYAKLQGSYERLWAGQVSEALVDLTGGLAERWSLGDCGTEEDQGRGSSDSDWVRKRRLDLDLLHAVREGCSVSCSVHSAPGGASELGQFHALSVMEWVDVRTVERGGVRLIRIRNPWGRRCWEGAWRESGEGWNSLDPACTLNLLGRAQEAEFWVDETEFLLQFDDVTVGYPINEEGHLQSIYSAPVCPIGKLLTHSHQTSDRWVKGHSAGGCRNNSSFGSNPQFWLRVFERGEVLVSLLQHRRYSRNTGHHYTQSPEEGSSTTQHQHYQAIALHMWKVEKKCLNLSRTLNSPPCASTHCHAYEREVVLHTHLDPGCHLLIPSTFLQGGEGSFLLRVFSSSPTSLSAVKTPGPSLPLVTEGGEWETNYLQGAWVTGSSAGGSRNFLSHWQNPRFPVTMGDNIAGSTGVNVRVTLHQNCPDTDLQAIGFHLYKTPEGQEQAESTVPREEEPVASCIPHCYTQAVSLACCLPPGAYVIVPSTYQPDSPGQFTLTVARKIHRRVVKSQERLGRAIQEVSHISVMRS
uniref:calpain-10 isoform X1 n=1 Tax=Oncorhynchus gorbuscha TaxID=8017 RepID=UPI001EAEED86|nr:calpain-10 isoform X1 [Oncorhynchus gorbuscha]XP_046188578.1 calpain-10 isoform X1 [Oncorhynchus gorbuscha]XP_046188579.1 calpain-10 isoform X1 [Oncorhynchus gorbuscha]XP_046188580.1 calpain-10 isoform X1 [Oncorhynchus gorbuscha]